MSNKFRRLEKKLKPLSDADAAIQAQVRKMTNWQRNQWASKGYPKSLAEIDGILALDKSRGDHSYD